MYHNYDYLGAPVIEQAVEAAQRGDSFAGLRRRVNSMINISSSYLRILVKERIGCIRTSIGKDVDEVLEFADPNFPSQLGRYKAGIGSLPDVCRSCRFSPQGSGRIDCNILRSASGNFIVDNLETKELAPLRRLIISDTRIHDKEIMSNAVFIAEREDVDIMYSQMRFPQDHYVVGDNAVVYTGKWELGVGFENMTRNSIVSEGGRYAIGNEDVFCCTEDFKEDDISLLRRLFGRRRLRFVPSPSTLGIKTNDRIDTHIDQFIGGPLRNKDGRLVLPIDSDYLAKLGNYQALEKDIIYFPVDSSLLEGIDGHHLLNYPVTPQSSNHPAGTVYLCPTMYDLLKGQDHKLQLEWGNIVKLPYSVPINNIKAGLKCCINFV